jgi:hypothetical protein
MEKEDKPKNAYIDETNLHQKEPIRMEKEPKRTYINRTKLNQKELILTEKETKPKKSLY